MNRNTASRIALGAAFCGSMLLVASGVWAQGAIGEPWFG